MPIPTSISDLSQTAADNYPTGSEVIGANLDNYLRAHASFIKSFYSLASSSITAASSVDVAASDGESVLITGSATITSLGAGYTGCLRELRFDDVCTLTNSANLLLPGGSDLSTSDGSVLQFRCTAPGVWTYIGGSNAATSATGIIPQRAMAADKTLSMDDAGSHVLRTAGDLTIPPNSSVPFETGTAISIINGTTTTMSVKRGSGVTLYMATSNTNSNRSLVGRGICTLLKTGIDTWYVSGAGLT